MREWLAPLFVPSLAAASPAQAQSRKARALEVYGQAMNGEVRLADLSGEERADVAEVDRRVRGLPLYRRSLA